VRSKSVVGLVWVGPSSASRLGLQKGKSHHPSLKSIIRKRPMDRVGYRT
jgi:hypothetical protein